jgi:hypothetical protein
VTHKNAVMTKDAFSRGPGFEAREIVKTLEPRDDFGKIDDGEHDDIIATY